MASSHSSNNNEAAKMEQIIKEFFYKSVHIILESRSPYVSSSNYSGEQALSSPSPSRSPSSSSSSSVRSRAKWFNLALRECPSGMESLDLCGHSNFEPVVVDVILEQKPLGWEPVTFSSQRDLVKNLSSKDNYSCCMNSDREESSSGTKSEKIIERWFVQHESGKGRDCSSGSRRSSSNNLSTLYKKLILLMRSLYATVRLLPAYKIFHDLNSSGQVCALKLVPKISSVVEAFTSKEEADMQRFWFTPVDTSCGRLCLSVLYRSLISGLSSESSSTLISPQFIPDYVGSPLADPLRRLPPHLVSHTSPFSSPFCRRNSCSDDHYKASAPLVSFSPSATDHPKTSPAHKKNKNFDEYCPSPSFSTTPSPSPAPSLPVHIPGSHRLEALLRSESAPVNIPAPRLAVSPELSCKQNVPPSPPLKISKVGILKTDNIHPVQTGATIEKLFSLEKDECRKYSGVKLSSNSSRQISVDETEFRCTFDVEDDDSNDRGSRAASYNTRGHQCDSHEAGSLVHRKSRDAAVGALVYMLQKAPPLHQDNPTSINFSEKSKPQMYSNRKREQNPILEAVPIEHGSSSSSSIISSKLCALKTIADALEELRSYKKMKSLLLSGGGKSHASTDYASGAEHSIKVKQLF